MKTLLASILLCVSLQANAIGIDLPVVKVLDGDTIKVKLYGVIPPFDNISIRLLGVDAPETPAVSYKITGDLGKASCVEEAEKALKAKEFLTELVENNNNIITINNIKVDKYGGRYVSDVYVGKIYVVDLLLKNQLVQVYSGKGAKPKWCP
jgi:endonuclease YncB( thermonuclease family)